jgi:hypothetical protein
MVLWVNVKQLASAVKKMGKMGEGQIDFASPLRYIPKQIT